MRTETKNTKAFYNTEIPSDWEIKNLGECCLVKGEYGINAPAVEFSDDLPAYLRITDIDENGNYTINKRASVGDPNYEQFILETGDIVFARTGATVGKTYLYKPADGTLVFAGFLIRFRTNEKLLSSQHLKYFTETKQYWDWVKTVSMRSGQPGINAEEYATLKIPLPPLPEQKAIAQVLSTADAAIHTTEKLIAQKELLKKWLMQQLLTGKKRLKGFNGEWEDVELGELLEYEQPTKYLVKNTLYDDSYKTPVLTAGKTFILGYTNETNGICNDLPVIIFDDFTTASKFVDFPFKAKSSAMKLLRPKLNTNLKFVYEAMQLMNYSVGGHERHWISKFVYLTIPCPTLEEQTAIAQVLQAADQEISLLKAKAEKLREQKKGLMQVLLTGKVRLKINNE